MLTAAYKWGAAVVGMTAASWEAERGSIMSMGMEDVPLVHLGAGCLAVVGRGPRKGEKLPSLLEGPVFWPGAMVERKVQPERLGVWCARQERVLVVCW